jgi:hypothetical protein
MSRSGDGQGMRLEPVDGSRHTLTLHMDAFHEVNHGAPDQKEQWSAAVFFCTRSLQVLRCKSREIVIVGLARRDRKWSLNDGQIPNPSARL